MSRVCECETLSVAPVTVDSGVRMRARLPIAPVDRARRAGRWILGGALIASLAIAGCASRPTAVEVMEPGERLARAERVATSPSASSAAIARAGLLTWVIAGDGERADVYFERALRSAPKEPLAHLGRSLLATERLDEAGAVTSALAVIEGAPESPLAELAAGWLSANAGISSQLDEAPVALARKASQSSLGLSGRAALRVRESLLAFADARNDRELADALRSSLGTPTVWTLVGPLHALRVADMDKPSPFDDPAHVFASTYDGAAGAVHPRIFQTPDGHLSLEGEPWAADVFEAVTDVRVARGGEHLLSFRGAGMARVYVDGVEVLRRSVLPERPADRSFGAVRLSAETHRVRVRFSRAEGASFALTLSRLDGAPAALAFDAPTAGSSPSPEAAAEVIAPPPSLESQLASAVRDEALGAYLGILALLQDAPESARARLDETMALCGEGPALQMLRADLNARHADLPRGLATALITRDLDAALAKAPWISRAAIHRFDQERGDHRFDDAAVRLDAIEAQLGAKHPRVLLSRARLAADRGNAAAARKLADQVLESDSSRCDALEMRATLARSGQEIAVENATTERLLTCPNGIRTLASRARVRGDLDAARRAWERLVEERPSSMFSRFSAADVAMAQGDVAGAERMLQPLLTQWPRAPEPLRRLAAIRERAGDTEGARRLRKRALAVDGSDLSTMLALSVDERSEPLSWAARDGREVIERYLSEAPAVNAPGVQVLDLGAMEVLPDGSLVERVHSIVQVLDKSGIDRWGEVHLPSDAHVLVLRTVKADGTVLEAEHIAQKDSISMPNLEPGDFVEYEFVRTHGSRGAALPGWQGGSFFFRTRDLPFHESTYLVRAPASVGLEVDAHRIAGLQPPTKDGEFIVFAHTERNVEPYLREPHAPNDGEVLPWVEVGAGAGQADAVRSFADYVALRARTSPELRAFVRGIRDLPSQERIHAIVDRAREAVRTDTGAQDFSSTPTAILANGRGNRLLLVKAALDEVGIRSRFVLARPFGADPASFRFPRSDALPQTLLLAETESGERVWLDLDSRHSPVGRIRSSLSESEGWLVPAPGDEPRRITLPAVSPWEDGVETSFDLALDDSGTLEGTVRRTVHGRTAASLRQHLEKANETELRQAQERSLASSFRGLELLNLSVEDDGDPDSPVTLHSTIRVANYGRRPDGSIALPTHFGAQRLGARYLVRGERRTPLLIANASEQRVSATLRLPDGATVEVPANVTLESPYGTFDSRWSVDGSAIRYEERSGLHRHRIAPESYADFQAFVSAVDSAQSRELELKVAER